MTLDARCERTFGAYVILQRTRCTCTLFCRMLTSLSAAYDENKLRAECAKLEIDTLIAYILVTVTTSFIFVLPYILATYVL